MDKIKSKLLVVDRDLTLVETESGEQFINAPLDQQLLPGVFQALEHYSKNGWEIVIASNQRGCDPSDPKAINPQTGKTWTTLKKVVRSFRYTFELAPQISKAYFCPDGGETCCILHNRPWWHPFNPKTVVDGPGEDPRYALGGFRKPNPGMLNLAAQEFAEQHRESKELVTFEFLYVGDSEIDKKAALAANFPFMWAVDWRQTIYR